MWVGVCDVVYIDTIQLSYMQPARAAPLSSVYRSLYVLIIFAAIGRSDGETARPSQTNVCGGWVVWWCCGGRAVSTATPPRQPLSFGMRGVFGVAVSVLFCYLRSYPNSLSLELAGVWCGGGWCGGVVCGCGWRGVVYRAVVSIVVAGLRPASPTLLSSSLPARVVLWGRWTSVARPHASQHLTRTQRELLAV